MDIQGYDDFSLVGAGGNAHVYRAHRNDTDEFVAVKVLRGGGDDTVRRRFERERNAMGTLESLDHVAPVLESGITETGDPYIVMPLFSGGSLQQRVSSGPVPWREALELVEKVADAVAQAHGRRILHLDVKPANVLLDEDGEPFLADFGISEAVGATASMSAQMMTPAYTPPERLDGAKPSEQTDVYGLGGLTYALLAGEAPFVLEEGMTPAAMFMAVLNEDVPTHRLADFAPPVVVDLVSRTLSKSIDERPKSAANLRDLIAEILADDSLPAFDPIVPFRVVAGEAAASQADQGAVQVHGGLGGELVSAPPEPVGQPVAEIVSGAGADLAGDGELLLLDKAANEAVTEAEESEESDRLFAVWVAAAIVFVVVGVAGAITATAWNGLGAVDVSNDQELALDEITSASVATAESTDELGGNTVTSDDGVPFKSDGDSASGPESTNGPEAGNDPEARSDDAVGATDGTSGAVEISGAISTTGSDESIAGDESGESPASPDQSNAAEPEVLGTVTGNPQSNPVTPVVISPTGGANSPTTPSSAPNTPRLAPVTPDIPSPVVDPPATTTTTTTTVAIQNEPLQFEERIDIGDIGDTSVRFRFTTSAATGYTVTVRSGGTVASTQTGTAAAGVLEGVTVAGLTPGTDYSVQVTLNGSPSVTSTPVAFRTSGGNAAPAVAQVVVQNLRVASVESTRFQVNYESNVCANGSFIIRDANGTIVGSNSGQPDGCTTRHLGVPGFWTPALKPNSSYVITVTVEANGQGLGNGNTASQSISVTTSG